MCFLSPYEQLETMFIKVYMMQWQQISQLANELQTTVSPLPLEGQNPLLTKIQHYTCLQVQQWHKIKTDHLFHNTQQMRNIIISPLVYKQTDKHLIRAREESSQSRFRRDYSIKASMTIILTFFMI